MQLRRVQVQEERVLVLRVCLQVVRGVLDRLLVQERDVGGVDLLDLLPLPAGIALDGADDVPPRGHHLLVIEREVRVVGRVGVGVGVQVVQRRVAHLVKAVRDGHRVIGLAQMPLADLAGAVAGLLEDARERPFAGRQPAALAGHRHRRHAAADRKPAGDRRGPARRAARLAVKRHELQAFGGQPVEVGRGCPAVLTAAVTAQVTPANVVGHEQDDVGAGPLLACHNMAPFEPKIG